MEFAIKSGTSSGGDSLCRTCQSCHLIRGFRETEEIMICEYVYPNRTIPFAVRECSNYRSSITPTPKQMEEIALIICTEAARQPAGFAGMGFTTDAEKSNGEAAARSSAG